MGEMSFQNSRQTCTDGCNDDIELSATKFQCSDCGQISDVSAPVYDGMVSSAARPIDRGRKQIF